MAHAASGSVVRQIGALFDGGSVAGLSDRQLLCRFIARRDAAGEAAFAALVARHGPMVLHVCRQLLRDHQHAEDAFQAVFLVLARRARSVREPDLLGPWLYGVALRTARKANARLARQRNNEREKAMGDANMQSGPAPDQSMIAREDALALHAEIEGLPSVFRLPVVLCYFEGLSLDEAARRLRCPEGTLRSRLARARDKLRRGLTRRGAFLSASALASVLDSTAARAAVSSSLVRDHDQGRDQLRGRTGRRLVRDGPCPRGTQIHVCQEDHARRSGHTAVGRRRDGCGVRRPSTGSADRKVSTARSSGGKARTE